MAVENKISRRMNHHDNQMGGVMTIRRSMGGSLWNPSIFIATPFPQFGL